MLLKTNKSPFLYKTQILLILLTLILSFFSGCSSSSDIDTVITVCNYDDDDMTIELRRMSDDYVEDSFDLEELLDSSNTCDTFKNMEEGRYYLIIFYEGTTDERDRTSGFDIDDEDQITFHIDSHEDIEKIN